MAINWKKIRKIALISFGVILIILGSGIGYLYYHYYGKYDINKEKYPHQIGYLSAENLDFNEGFLRCDSTKIPIGYYHSSSKFAFKENKRVFKKKIVTGFVPGNYNDTGFLNIRFIINCHGEIGDIEVNELDTNLEKTTLNNELVKKIIDLSLKNENWKPYDKKEGRDMYMYLIFKLENGKISEILP